MAGDFDEALLAGLPGPVAGVDEVGRGPWAGPLVAAAALPLAGVALPAGLADSKALTPGRRETLAAEIRAAMPVAIAVVEAAEIDALGLGPANDAAMRRAAETLAAQAPFGALAIDGRRVPPGLAWPARAVVRGDARVAAIAAASIVAKVARDAVMVALEARHPGYGWARNKGYGTAEHAAALARLGPTAEHRRCFKPVREAMGRVAPSTHPADGCGVSDS
ncbi:MAG: ribonuclease HII [Pseudomonadota bacterium]